MHSDNYGFNFFQSVFCINLNERTDRWAEMTFRFKRLGILDLVERFPAVSTPENRHRGCAKSIRSVIVEAQRRGLSNCLIIEDDAVFLDRAVEILGNGLRDLAELDWDLFYLGGATPGSTTAISYPFAAGSASLKIPSGMTCTHAIAFNHTAYARILTDVPVNGDALDSWLTRYGAIDQYLASGVEQSAFRAYLLHPRIAIQPALQSAGRFDPVIFDPALCEEALFRRYLP